MFGVKKMFLDRFSYNVSIETEAEACFGIAHHRRVAAYLDNKSSTPPGPVGPAQVVLRCGVSNDLNGKLIYK